MENRQANVSGVNHSVVSIGTAGAIANTVIQPASGADTLSDLLAQLEGLLQGMPLDPAARDEVQAEVRTVQAQLGSPRPKRPIVQESLRTIRTLLEGVAGNAAYAHLLAILDKLVV